MRRRAGLVAASLVLLAGCGGSSTPSDDVPALGDALDRVDEAIVAGQYDDARSALDELVATATAGREDGELGGAETERILAAASELSAVLPEEPAEEPVEEEPEPEPTTEPEPEPSEEETPTEEPTEEETPTEEPTEEEPDEELDEELEEQTEEPGNSGENGNGNGNNGNGNGN